MSGIHPTAVVGSGAEISPDARIGPYCVIGNGVKIGAGTELRPHVTIDGPCEIGDGNLFYPYCSIGGRSQDLKYTAEPTHLVIGDRNTFREFCTANRGTAPGSKTVIGHDNHFLAYSHIAHDCTIGNHVIFSNNGTVAGHVEVGDYAIIGGLSGVHQFCRIGTHSIVGGCTKIVQDLPPYFIADGNPAEVRGVNQVGLERHGFGVEQIRALREAYRLVYRAKVNVKQAVEAIREKLPHTPEIERLVRFIEDSRRGIIR